MLEERGREGEREREGEEAVSEWKQEGMCGVEMEVCAFEFPLPLLGLLSLDARYTLIQLATCLDTLLPAFDTLLDTLLE